MFAPIVESLDWAKAHNPRSIFRKRRFNFITIHCTFQLSIAEIQAHFEADPCTDLYILSAAIVGSILLYPAGRLAYIDALFFASGAATQSGLNTYAALLIWGSTR